ncbi:hypothetical protein Poli38472_010358 [Pythium oligandrum]|uniref:EF-hand domain-containing protein n=1 Tax=Pythium oligandrum TaxID=41045 RepID=A0A8K1C2W7_PYTOL|nr:hypothetical protein Poli38472_010358 [Pythium oligandrum]|eukprot:TMW55476.1 hypothetical protein Poli38472_010358 [Pythium oligandrum]
MTQKYREQAPPDKHSGAYSHENKNQHSSLAHARKTPRQNLVTNGPIIASDLSDFDLRKCHPRTVVTRHHGFLQQQDIQKLIDETGYDRTELYALWARFKALCSIAKSPKGIDKDTFCHGIPQLSVEDQFFIDRVFKILDADGSNILEWQEFVDALSALENGDVNKRIDFLFRVYDLNGDGMIHRNEVMQFLLASLLVKPNDDLEEVAKHFVKKIFTSVGRQDSEVMCVEDAKKYMREHPSADIYTLFGRTMVTKRPKLDVNK